MQSKIRSNETKVTQPLPLQYSRKKKKNILNTLSIYAYINTHNKHLQGRGK